MGWSFKGKEPLGLLPDDDISSYRQARTRAFTRYLVSLLDSSTLRQTCAWFAEGAGCCTDVRGCANAYYFHGKHIAPNMYTQDVRMHCTCLETERANPTQRCTGAQPMRAWRRDAHLEPEIVQCVDYAYLVSTRNVDL
jgi:hypothetical protein